LSDFDNRQRWVTSVDYAIPVGKNQKYLNQGGVADAVLGGWHIGGIVTFRSGFPFSPVISYDPTNTGSQGLMRAQQIGSGGLAHPNINMWFNVSDFQDPSCNCFGNAGKNILEGPGEKSADLSIRKIFALSERFRLEFRTEFFNAFNTTQFSSPGTNVSAANFGVISSTAVNPRIIQFALKLNF